MPLRESPLFVDGRWINGQVGGTWEVLNPATSQPIAVVPDAGPEQARAAVEFVEAVRGIKVGSGFDPGVQVGPLINAETLQKVEQIVDDAVSGGARPLVGGRRLTGDVYGHGFFYEPTVLADVREEMPLVCDEIFSPVAPVLVFDTDEEIVSRSNNTTYGLAAYLCARDLRRVIRIGEALEYGLVCVNDASGYTHEIPFGGFKESGLGREGGRQGIAEYMEVKSISLNIS
jgi:succinate-semialdehyde dehydrogenase / glutarate-semialdehyde dehydrogenase